MSRPVLYEDAGNGMTRCLGCCCQSCGHDQNCPVWLASINPGRLAEMYIALEAKHKRISRKCGAMIRSLKGDPWVLRGKYARRFVEQMRAAERGELASGPCATPPDIVALRKIAKALSE